MDFKTLIKFAPLIGVAIGLLIGEQTRPTIFFTKIPFFELFDVLSSQIPSDQKIAKDQLMHIGIYSLIGGVLGSVLSAILQKQNSKED